jgi:hypothetical protein
MSLTCSIAAAAKPTEEPAMSASQFDHSKLNLAWMADELSLYTVGQDGIEKIVEHAAQGEGDRWFYDVHYVTGKVIRVFTPHQVCYSPESPDISEDDIPF